MSHPDRKPPRIELHLQSIFDFDFKKLAAEREVLVLGNPPWVTNSMLSALGSDNLPQKSNFKKFAGLDALTCKSNFDIGEFISLMLLRTFEKQSGQIAFLIKNTVFKNLLHDQRQNQFSIFEIEKHQIDAQKEFEVAVDASLFFARFAAERAATTCLEFDFYSQNLKKRFGWADEKFVSNLDFYKKNSQFDGACQFEWRQGVKHDCSKVMELERLNGHFVNGRGESVSLEEDLVFGLLKSSDLKNREIAATRKFVIVTQKKIGQDTAYIQSFFPKTWQYLVENRSDFDNRKSSIYLGKPAFSIFGIGEYSFAPFKVAISGLYKTSTFSLVLPAGDKPVLLDDTCYFIGFEKLSDAQVARAILNSAPVQEFLQSLIFWDSKRAITKELLSRLDFQKICESIDFQTVYSETSNLKFSDWEDFQLHFERSNQLSLF